MKTAKVSSLSSSSTSDPESLLDTIDSFHHNNNVNNAATSAAKNNNNASSSTSNNPNLNSNSSTTSASTSTFDPIEFLNHHYQTESSLITALPSLRSSLSTRLTSLSESISTSIQSQSELSSLLLSDISSTKSSISSLQSKILTVQLKAQKSEKAVMNITSTMKQLDYAKKHLSKTITALKRLHMLLHGIHQLNFYIRQSNPVNYECCSNLIDATFLLLGHFEGYMSSVEKMRVLKQEVEYMRVELNDGIVWSFRVVGFGSKKAMDMTNDRVRDWIIQKQQQLDQKQQQEEKQNNIVSMATPLPPLTLSHACHVLDALGIKYRSDFISIFAKDHLQAYIQLFHPRHNTSSGGGDGSGDNPTATSATLSNNNTLESPKPSFKITPSRNTTNATTSPSDTNNTIDDNDMHPSSSNPNPSSLDQIERRYAWYRRTLREIDESFPNVFPKHWNMYYHVTFEFLKETGKHILLLFSNVNNSQDKHLRDRDVENVTVLLKALQKTMLFEKEMSAWLQRDYNVQFINENDKSKNNNEDDKKDKKNMGDNDEEALEFDESGKAVAASSAEGIRIKYERQMKERKKKEEKAARAAVGLDDDIMNHSDPAKDRVQEPVPPLLGVASTAFDRYMKPYIALEEQNMDEQLKESASDKTVDTRGELPVFTSSTELFLYIKNSITRCTVLTKGRTLFLLYRAFQNTLRKYAKVLAGKFPSTLSGAAAAIIGGLTGGSNAVYRIPPGEEKTVCYVIDTCEYCSDTVEALQDLIADKIEEKYKSKIDMSGEQEAFQDVTAKGIRVLVSGLIQRTESAFKSLSNINWSSMDVVGEESSYVRTMHNEIQPFVVSVKGLLPNSYFRSFCDQFAMTFTNSFYMAITKCKRISESGTQQLLLDVYNLKTLLLRIPVLELSSSSSESNDATLSPSSSKPMIGSSSAATIAPAMYTKMVTKQFARIETLLKLIGTPSDLLIDVFKVQWNGGSAFDLQTIMNLKGMKRNEQAAMLEKFGVDPATAYKGAAAGTTTGGMMTENIQALQDRSSDVAAKVNSDLIQMKQKVEDFRKAFR